MKVRLWIVGICLALAVGATGCATLPPPAVAPAYQPTTTQVTPSPNIERPVPLSNQQPPAPVVSPPVIRGQAPNTFRPPNEPAAGGGDHMRFPMQASGAPVLRGQNPGYGYAPQTNYDESPVMQFAQETIPTPGPQFPGVVPPGYAEPLMQPGIPLPPTVDFDVYLEETRTGRFMFGMGVNSDLGVTGQIVIDERNFDWRRPPTSWQDFANGTAWRGGGQGFRMEAMPGNRVQRYLVNFTQPYLYLGHIPTPFSLSLSGFFFDRRYFDWDEQRLGGRMALGYRVTHDLSLSGSVRAENVNIHDPRTALEPQLNDVLGDNSLFSGKMTLTHDTRDTPFAATEGHLIEFSYEQVFGSFEYPRGEVDYRQYFLVRERPDGSGRHTLAYSFKLGMTGSQTPVFENYFAGGFSTMRGFDFRGASPVGAAGVMVGGEFRFLGSVEYMFPITADDMVKGVFFCDYGTVEEGIELHSDNYRVAPGLGLRISIPAMGPAPLALDLAFPVAHADTDDLQNFSFFFGFGR